MSVTFLPETVQLIVCVVLFWIGYGSVTGLLATLLVPHCKLGAWKTLVCGAMGSTLGPFILSQFVFTTEKVNPLHPCVLLVSVACSVVLLWIYRLMLLRAVLETRMTDTENRVSSGTPPTPMER
ncbi:MAG: hypothetical protein PHE53_02160 [Thermoguttaceae bacterium]|nr:hypothetical protein [Thermoguttaceae bacterium]